MPFPPCHPHDRGEGASPEIPKEQERENDMMLSSRPAVVERSNPSSHACSQRAARTGLSKNTWSIPLILCWGGFPVCLLAFGKFWHLCRLAPTLVDFLQQRRRIFRRDARCYAIGDTVQGRFGKLVFGVSFWVWFGLWGCSIELADIQPRVHERKVFRGDSEGQK